MYSLGFINTIRYSPPQEFNYFIKNYCQKQPLLTSPEANVIRLYGNGYYSDTHASLIVGTNKLFEKGSPEAEHKYVFRSLTDLTDEFESERNKLLEFTGCNNVSNKFCDELEANINAYKCSNKPLNEAERDIDKKLRELFDKIGTIDDIYGETLELQREILQSLQPSDYHYIEFLTSGQNKIPVVQLSSKEASILMDMLSSDSGENFRLVLQNFELIADHFLSETTHIPEFYKNFIEHTFGLVLGNKMRTYFFVLYQSTFLVLKTELQISLFENLLTPGLLKPEDFILVDGILNNLCSSDRNNKRIKDLIKKFKALGISSRKKTCPNLTHS